MIAEGLRRVIEAHKDHPRLLSLLAIYLRAVERMRDLAIEVKTKRGLAGEGAQLDQLGRLVMLQRGDLDDDAYRLELRADLRALRSNGTALDLLEVLELSIADGARYDLDELTMTIVIEVLDALERVPRALRRAKAGGVALFVVWSPEPVETSFLLSYDDEGEADGTAQGFAYDDEDESPGGPLAFVG